MSIFTQSRARRLLFLFMGSLVGLLLNVRLVTAEYAGPELLLPLPSPDSWCVNTAVNDSGDWYHTDEIPDEYHTKPAYAGGYYSIDFDDNYGLAGNATETSECYDTDLYNSDTYVNILAAAAGTVTHVTDEASEGDCSQWGNNCYVAINHGNGYTIKYMHLVSGSIAVNLNDTVQQGQVLGVMGNTGESTGPHLHFEVEYQGISKSTIDELQSIELDGIAMTDYEVGQAYESSNEELGTCALPDLLSTFVASTSTATNNPDLSATYLDDSDPSTSILEVEVSIGYDYSNGGTEGTFTVSKADGSVFSTSGDMYLQVGTYESYGTEHDQADIASYVSTAATLTENFNNYCADSYPKDYYIRYESADSDGDGNSDGYAVVGPITITEIGVCTGSGVCLESTLASDGDEDGDGLLNGVELNDYGTDPTDDDTDADGLNDGDEINTYGSDPLDSDTDGDELMDGSEVTSTNTSPTDSDSDDDGVEDGAESTSSDGGGTITENDSDGDGLDDWVEEALSLDPNDTDTDDDGLTDGWEVSNGEDPHSADGDGDGLLDGEEIELGTMTGYYDSDYDGLWDGAELDDYNTDPLDADSDDDTIEDGDEVDAGTDPADADSDDDGISDGDDAYPLLPAGEIEAILENSDSAIAIDGDVIVVSTTRDDPADTWGTLPDFGTVSVYRWDGTLWNLEAELTGDDTRDFGHAVALDDDLLVIAGDSRSDYHYGAVYVYRYDGATWNEEATLSSSDIASGDGFSYSLAVDDDVIAVGANGYDEGVIDLGAAYLFRYNGSTWSQEQKLTGVYDSGEGVLERNFTGAAIALDGDLLLVGDYSDGGGVYVYAWNGSTWNEQTIVTASDSTTSDYFGSAVALAGDVAVIGAKGDGDDTGTSTGSVYVFRSDGTTWTEEAKLTASDGGYDDSFGYDVAISDELIVVGTRNESVSTYGYDIGKAYTFRWTGSNWEEEEIMKPEGETNTFRFGNAVDVSGDLVLVSWSENETAYVYSRPDPDSDNDGLTNDQESEYGTDAAISDTDGDTIGDYEEVQAGTDPLDSDTDDDGLLDSDDAEPLVPLDTDGDGVTDTSDACTATVVANSYDTVDATGCALSDLDTDADELNDYVETVSCAATNETKIFPDDATTNIGFGTAVGLNDDEAIMGAVGYREDGWTFGSAYIFRKKGTSWDQEVQLLASDRNYNRDHSIYVSPYYGSHVAISDDVAVIGAHGDGENGGEYAGAAYAYNYDGSTWNETKLLASNGVAYDYYGYAVAISDDVAVIGAPYTRHDSGARGSVYVYRWDGTAWNEQAILTPSDGDSQKFFGWSVAVVGDSILVGDRSDSGTGAAYLYEWNGTDWNQANIFSASDGTAGDDYGGAVSLAEDMVSVGARYTNRTYVYQTTGSTWTETILTGDEVEGTDYYGDSVAVSANVLLASAPNDDDSATNAGAIYMNCSDGSNWHEEKITASDATTDEQFGSALSLHDTDLLVGVPDDVEAGSGVGAAYFYQLTEPSFTDVADADTDDDTLLDGVDPEPLIPQDTDADGVPDISDTCPTTAIQDTLDVVDEVGCALSDLDTDDDSFTDYVELTEGYDPDNVDYVVTKTADTSDGTCDADCSLREAITAGNANTSTPSLTIDFDIPTTDAGCAADGVCTITPTRILPTITRGYMTIAGDTQPEAVVLNGAAAGTNVRGLYINSSDNTIASLVVNQFSKNGIEIMGGSGNTVTGCLVGTDSTGTVDLGNTGVGIYVSTAASLTTITDNVVLGNNATGIVAGQTTTVADNWIGTNTAYGVYIIGSDNVISDNQITGNGNSGIYLATTALTNQITGNTINSNTASGIYSAGTNTTIAGNTIASNTKNGIQVNNGGGSSIIGNTIELNQQHGILIVKGTNTITSNVITANGLKGVYLNTTNTIGNQISLNSFYANTGTGITLANGANNSKATPRITAGTITSGAVTISGTATSDDTVEVFVASSDNEGQTYLATATTDSGGSWSIATTTALVPANTKVVATATDSTSGSSAFSTVYTVR